MITLLAAVFLLNVGFASGANSRGTRSVFCLIDLLVFRSCGHRLPGLHQFSDCLASAPPARLLSDSTFRVRPPLLRTEAIGGRQACGLAQVSEKKNQPEGLNAQADQVYPG
jgi:hypothetical protein